MAAHPEPMRTITLEEMEHVVGRDLLRLLNTRSRRGADTAPENPTVIDYGIAELAIPGQLLPETAPRLERLVERAVGAFEPRLRNVRADVVVDSGPDVGGGGSDGGATIPPRLLLVLDATLALDGITRAVRYRFSLTGTQTNRGFRFHEGDE